MADPKFYESMPETLPSTLPAGTRFSACGNPDGFAYTFTGEAERGSGDHANLYVGPFSYAGNRHPSGAAFASAVDWASVPLPAPETPECAGCGGHVENLRPTLQLTPDEAVHLCKMCWGIRPFPSGAARAVYARRSSKASAQDSSFAAHEGPMAIVLDGHGNTDTVPACEACRAPARAGKRFCAYCGHRGVGDMSALNDEDFQHRSDAARARMDAADRRELGVVNLKERAELQKPHPWTSWSNPGSES